MAVQKSFVVKVYDQDGSTRLTTVSTDKPETGSEMYCKSLPTFETKINGGQGECVLDLKTSFDDFDEGTTIDFMNIVKIYAVVINSDVSPPTQTTTLIYTGFISRYEPYLEDGDEGVRVTCLGLVSLLAKSYYKSGSTFEVVHSSQDPTVIAQAVITHFNTIFGGSLLGYNGSSIPSTVGTSVSFTFTDQKWIDCVKKAVELAGTDWWWAVREDGLLYVKAKPGSATHTFTIGKDIQSITTTKDSEAVVNDVQVRRTGGTASDYSDATSQLNFGTGSPATGKFSEIISDTGLTDATAADQRGNKEINDKKNEKIVSPFTVNMKYNLESIHVGETCRIRNFDGSNTFFSSNMLIVGVSYEGDTCRIEVEGSQSFGQTLSSFVQATSGGGSSSSSGGSSGPGFVDRETPSGSINSSNVTFTLSQTPVAGSEHYFLNGMLLNGSGNDYTQSGTTGTFTFAPATGSALLVSYRTSSGSVNFVDREVPSGTINGSNATFTLAHTPTTGAEMVYLNGVLMNGSGNDYTASGTSIVFVSPPASGSTILVSYRY